MKKLLLLIISLLISMPVYPAKKKSEHKEKSETFRVGDFEYATIKSSKISGGGVELKKDYSNKSDVLIAETVVYRGVKYSVKCIGENAFKNNKNIREVTIPGSVILLDPGSFYGLKNLKKIKVLPYVELNKENFIDNPNDEINHLRFTPDLIIGFSAIAKCESLETVDLTNRKTLIQYTKLLALKSNFANCKSLKTIIAGDIEFSDKNKKVFQGCHQLENVIIGNTNPSKYENHFEKDCPFMTEIFPKISKMSDEQYLSYISNDSKTAGTIEDDTQYPQDSHNPNLVEMNGQGQKLRLSEDIMTVPIQRKDLNGNVCALIKVLVSKKGLTFDGNVIGAVEHKNGCQYWVYVSPGTKKVRINVPGEKQNVLDLDEYNDFQTFESKKIYEYSFETLPTQEVSLKFAPKDATVLIDGKLYDNYNGEIHTHLPLGEHTYIIAAKGYVTTEGIVKLTSNGPANIIVNLNIDND